MSHKQSKAKRREIRKEIDKAFPGITKESKNTIVKDVKKISLEEVPHVLSQAKYRLQEAKAEEVIDDRFCLLQP